MPTISCKIRTAHQLLKSKRRQATLHQKPLPTFSQVNQKSQMVKISPTFPERVIDTVCYTTQMYKVKLRFCILI